MNFQKLFKSQKEDKHHKRKGALLWRSNNFTNLRFLIPLLIILLFIAVGFVRKQDFVLSAFRYTKPKPLILSTKTLPTNVQHAIEDLAKQKISEQEAAATLPNSSTAPVTVNNSNSVIEPFINNIQIALTTNPVSKAKLRLKRIDGYILDLQNTLKNDRSTGAVNKTVGIIQNIGQETGKIASDPKVQADQEVLTLLIAQYNRLTLTIQKVEDTLPMDGYLKIENARVNFLLKPAQASLNNAPNLEIVNAIGLSEVKKIVGNDYAELKAVEILTDLGSGFTPKTSEKLTAIQKELAISFEKRMSRLPASVRQRKLSDYINFSYGNPINQVKAFNKMQEFLSDREIIFEVNNLKELSLKRLADKIADADDKNLSDFLGTVVKNSNDLEVITQLQMQISDTRLEGVLTKKIIEDFGENPRTFEASFTKEADENSNLSDLATMFYLQKTLQNIPNGGQIQKTVGKIRTAVLNNFIRNISGKGFRTLNKLSYNPVSENADVRLLIPNPAAIAFLTNLKTALSPSQKTNIDSAIYASGLITSQHLLSGTVDSQVFDGYISFLDKNPAIKQTLGASLTPAKLQQVAKQVDVVEKAQNQKLFETIQQITQEIFITKGQANDESLLPDSIKEDITQLKTELPSRNIPQLVVPDDVTLPKIAKLPDTVESAIVTAAKDKIADENKPADLKLNLDNLAQDLGVSVPNVLPDNPLYIVKEAIRTVELVVTIDPLARADLLLKQDNEKTVEAAKLIQDNQSQVSVDVALKTLASVSDDFNKLKEHTDEVVKLAETQPEKVDQLVTQIIDNGLARQTVFSEIESNVHGDTYVKVEETRTAILADGVDTLLKLTNNDVQGLTEKLETAVQNQQGGALSDIKAVELLNEIARSQPEDTQKILQVAETKLAKNLETKLLEIPEEKRAETVLAYAENISGNPVRQFEAYDVLKDNFTSPETILLTEGLKDSAVSNLQDRLTEITDADTTQKFVESVIGSEPQDLKVVTEIELRVEPPSGEIAAEILPTAQKIEDIKANIEQNIVDTYQDKPQELANTDFFDNPTLSKTPDVVDIKVAQDVNEILAQSSSTIPEVLAVAKEEEQKIVEKFIENVSSPEFKVGASTNITASGDSSSGASVSSNTNTSVLASETLNPIPETLAQLIELKTEFPQDSSQINIAINTQVDLMQNNLAQIRDPIIFETYVTQIAQDPVVAQAVSQVGGITFAQIVEQKSQELQAQAVTDQVQLATTIAQVQQEIFSTPVNNPSPVEQTLSSVVQEQIQQIKQEIPAQQIPQVTIEASVQTSISVPAPTSVPAQVPIQQSAPAPVVPEVKTPETQSAPAAPAAPGL